MVRACGRCLSLRLCEEVHIATVFIGMSLGLALSMLLIGMTAVTLARWLGSPEPLAFVIGSAVVIETLILPADGPGPQWLAGAATAIAVLWVQFAWVAARPRNCICVSGGRWCRLATEDDPLT
jgi:hypothetical protein